MLEKYVKTCAKLKIKFKSKKHAKVNVRKEEQTHKKIVR